MFNRNCQLELTSWLKQKKGKKSCMAGVGFSLFLSIIAEKHSKLLAVP